MKRQSDNPLPHKNALNSQFYAQPQEDKIAEEAARLLMEDPSIYAYDEIYDDMKQKQKQQKPQKAAPEPAKVNQHTTQKQESKYIKSILTTVGKREREHQIISSKMATKKAKREGAEGAEVFITMNYQKQLEARKQYEEEQQKADEYNQKHSIANKNKDMYEFTAQFLKNQLERPVKGQIKSQKYQSKTQIEKQPKQSYERKPDRTEKHKPQIEREQSQSINKAAYQPEQKSTQQEPKRDPLFSVDAAQAPKPAGKFFSQKAHQERMRLKRQQEEAQKAKSSEQKH